LLEVKEKPPGRTAIRIQPDAGSVRVLQGAFQDAQRFRPARRAVSRTTPKATIAAVESSGAGDAVALGPMLAGGAAAKPPSTMLVHGSPAETGSSSNSLPSPALRHAAQSSAAAERLARQSERSQAVNRAMRRSGVRSAAAAGATAPADVPAV